MTEKEKVSNYAIMSRGSSAWDYCSPNLKITFKNVDKNR